MEATESDGKGGNNVRVDRRNQDLLSNSGRKKLGNLTEGKYNRGWNIQKQLRRPKDRDV